MAITDSYDGSSPADLRSIADQDLSALSPYYSEENIHGFEGTEEDKRFFHEYAIFLTLSTTTNIG